MFTRYLAFSLIPILVLGSATSIDAQSLLDEQARQKAVAATRAALNLPDSMFLNPQRQEDLEEVALSFTLRSANRLPTTLFFFAISDQGYDLRADEVFHHSRSGGGSELYLVSVSAADGQAYRLFGFPDAEAEFNRMARQMQFVIKSEREAETYALFYFRCVLGPAAQTIVYSQLDIRQSAERYFHGYAPNELEADRRFKKWYKASGARNLGNRVGPRASRTNSGFAVSLFKIDLTPKSPPVIKGYDIKLTGQGQIQAVRARDLSGRSTSRSPRD